LSRIIGGGMAVHHAVQMHHLSSQVARQNTSRIITPRAQVAEVVREIIEVAPTTEDLQRFIDIVSREVDDPGLEYATVETEIRERTPFAEVLQFLSSSQNRTELVAYLGVLLVILQTVLMMTQKPVVVMTPDQLEQVIERVVEQVERDEQPEPPPPRRHRTASRTRLSGRVSARAYCGSASMPEAYRAVSTSGGSRRSMHYGRSRVLMARRWPWRGSPRRPGRAEASGRTPCRGRSAGSREGR
jgi:hypothetical protein